VMTSTIVIVAACGGTTGETTPTTTLPPTTTTTSTTTLPPTTTTTIDAASAELEFALEAVSTSGCVHENRTRELISAVDQDLMFEQTGINYQVAEDIEIPFSTAGPPLDRIHFLLYLNLQRVFYGLHGFAEVPPDPIYFYGHNGLVAPFTEDDVIGSWDPPTFAFVDSEPVDLSLYSFLRIPPVEIRLGDDGLAMAWDQAAEWLDRVDRSLPPSSVQSALALESMLEDLDRHIALFCAIVASEYHRTEDLLATAPADSRWLLDNIDIFFDELAAQDLLLMTELIQIMADHLSDPAVDWLRADDVDVSEALDGVTSTAEYIAWWHISLGIARNEVDELLDS